MGYLTPLPFGHSDTKVGDFLGEVLIFRKSFCMFVTCKQTLVMKDKVIISKDMQDGDNEWTETAFFDSGASIVEVMDWLSDSIGYGFITTDDTWYVEKFADEMIKDEN